MVVSDIISREVVDAFGWTFVHSIWQGVLLLILLIVLLVVLRKFSSSTKYLVCVSFLFFFLASNFSTFFLVYEPTYTVVRQDVIDKTMAIPNDEYVSLSEHVQADSDKEVILDYKVPLYVHLKKYFPAITTLWFLGVLLLSIKLIGSWIYLHRLKYRHTQNIDPYWEKRCRQIGAKLRLTKKYLLRISHSVSTPLVIGFFKPVVLLPVKAITGLTEKQIEAILAHELAHVKRNDYLINILQSVMEVIFFYHPAIWMISGRIRKERENCCDDLALSVTGQTIIFAEALLNIGILENHNKLALALAGTNSSLKDRVHRIFTPRTLIADFRERLITLVVVLLGALSLGMVLFIQPDKEQAATKEILPETQVNEEEGTAMEEIVDAQTPIIIEETTPGPESISSITPEKDKSDHKPAKNGETSDPKNRNGNGSISISDLINAINKGKTDEVISLLKEGVDINSIDSNGRSPLFIAVKNNNYELTRLLINNGANVQFIQDGHSILMEASDEADVRITELLLRKGAPINFKTEQEPGAIFDAIEDGNLGVVNALIKAGADIEVRDKEGRTPLLFAFDEGEIKIAQMLIENGADVNAESDSGWSVLMEASLRDQPELVEMLISEGANVNALSYHNHSALNGAVRREKLENARILIASGADVNWKYDGYTPLCEAARRNNYLLIKLLLENNADPEIGETSRGEKPLFMGSSEKDPRIVDLLIQHGASVDAPRYDGRTALFEAIESGSIANAKILIENGADVNWNNYDDLTPLMYAIERESLNMVVLLVENGADVNAMRKNGWTILQMAKRTNHSQIINYLISQDNK